MPPGEVVGFERARCLIRARTASATPSSTGSQHRGRPTAPVGRVGWFASNRVVGVVDHDRAAADDVSHVHHRTESTTKILRRTSRRPSPSAPTVPPSAWSGATHELRSRLTAHSNSALQHWGCGRHTFTASARAGTRQRLLRVLSSTWRAPAIARDGQVSPWAAVRQPTGDLFGASSSKDRLAAAGLRRVSWEAVVPGNSGDGQTRTAIRALPAGEGRDQPMAPLRSPCGCDAR